MATVLESLTVPGSFLHRIKASAPPISRIPRRSVTVPAVKGLKITPSSLTTGSFGSLSRSSSRSRLDRGGRIVCEAQGTAVEVPAVSDDSWQSLVLKPESPVLVEFWAPWCGPCRMIDPVISELAREYAGKIKCYKLNTDENPSIASRYGIRSIPTVIIFKSGEKKEAIIGAVPKTTLTTSLDKFL